MYAVGITGESRTSTDILDIGIEVRQ
jgi:hypothetical protein